MPDLTSDSGKLYNAAVDKQVTEGEEDRRRDLLGLLSQSPIPDGEMLSNLGLYLLKPEIARMIFLHEVYQRILHVPGVIMEFGVRWGQNLAFFEAFRGIYEPFNRSRKIIGFDTFEGFPSVSEHDIGISPGDFTVTKGYEEYLESLLATREREGTLAHLKRFELIKGDAAITVEKYLEASPETVIALAYFDMDIYPPTKAVMESIKPYLCRGSVVVLDELMHDYWPGETLALREVFGLNNLRLIHTPYSSTRAYFVWE
jgi:hypothetical protein